MAMSGSGIEGDALGNSGAANNLASTYGNRASSGYSILAPTLTQMATNPQGFGTQTVNNMNTAAQESAGGSNAGTTGMASLAAAATNNAGAYAPMATASARGASQQLSDAALGVQNQNAMVKEQQRQEGLSGLQGLYGTNVSAGMGEQGLSDQALGVANTAKATSYQNPWQKLAVQQAGGLLEGMEA